MQNCPAAGDDRGTCLLENGVRRIAIIGLGLMGTSLGLALRKRAPDLDLVGFDACPSSADHALALGAVCALAPACAAAAREADLVVLAVPVNAIASVAEALAGEIRSGAAVTDLGSTKARVVAECETLLGPRFVGGHPMAGSERNGPAHASDIILDGAPWILTPSERTCPAALGRAAALVRTATGRNAHSMSPDAHDRMAAYMSHAVHAVAYAVAACAQAQLGGLTEDAAGGSYRSVTRVARSDPGFWAPVLLDNAGNVSRALEEITDYLTALRGHLTSGDAAAVERHLAAGRAEDVAGA